MSKKGGIYLSANVLILVKIQEYDPDVIYTRLIKDIKSIFYTFE